LALAAGGRAGIRLGSRKNPKPEKCQKTAQSPTSPLHALLGGFTERQTPCLKTRTKANLTKLLHSLFAFSITKNLSFKQSDNSKTHDQTKF
jgi:hypothetical protein